MEVFINEEANATVARLVGRLDTAVSQDVSSALQPLMDAASGTVILDCSQMSYISSSGLRIFLGIRKEAAAKGGRVIVRNLPDTIRQVFMMTGFLNLFEIQ
ncbi:MAG: STAS domain-containing protein [Bacteroidales bacterium]|jgi:anti-sigma B factor antagonist|nr:STAS domain-containing protein [Bacteroidales bacterium]